MTVAPEFTVVSASLATDFAAIRLVRESVFIQEQGIPPELEWDEHDYHALHIIAWDREQQPIGTGRLLRDGRIGRMAVLPAWRGCGVGSAMLEALLNLARQPCHLRQVHLSAQLTAVGFYQKYGFTVIGDAYLEAGIPHQKMTRAL